MTSKRMRTTWLLAAAAVTGLALVNPAVAGNTPQPRDVAEGLTQDQQAPTRYIYAVRATTQAQSDKLAALGVDLLEHREGGNLFVMGDASVQEKIRKAGFDVRISETVKPAKWENPGGRIGSSDPNVKVADTFFGGYHTAAGHMAHMESVSSANPTLVKMVNFGKTYTKKYDMRALCITKLAAGDCEVTNTNAKPKFFMMTQTHAREIAAGEMSYRFIDQLVQGYGKDADLTAILDSTEIWIVPTANPDGLDIVAQGSRPSMQRKNRNPTHGNCSGDQVGVDLNRNNDVSFGGASTSKDPCNDTFPGKSANSEPENQAKHELWKKLFKDSREGNSPAPDSTTGYMLSIHTVAAMNLYPWEYTSSPAPNEKGLKGIANQIKTFNKYKTGQAANILYAASGGHDDFIYDKMGIPGATIELGGAGECGGGNFHPAYTACVDTYWKDNAPALKYLAKVAKQPYVLGLGPNVSSVTVDGDKINATVDARDFSRIAKDGAMPGDDVSGVEYSFDPAFANARTLDVSTSGQRAAATTRMDLTGRSAGRHLVYVRAKDKDGRYGVTTAAWVDVK